MIVYVMCMASTKRHALLAGRHQPRARAFSAAALYHNLYVCDYYRFIMINLLLLLLHIFVLVLALLVVLLSLSCLIEV